MSIIAIIHHDENITKIIDKSATHHEKIGEKIRTQLHSGTKSMPGGKKIPIQRHATMGLPQETLPDPCDFLKKKTGKLSHTQKITPTKHFCQRKEKLFATKEDIKAYDTKKKEAANVERNFISENIKTVLKMKPKEPEPRVVLEAHGESKRLRDGLEPIYIKTSSFGKTPDYLQAMIKNREKLHQMQKDATGVEKPKCHYIRRDEREQLLEVRNFLFSYIFLIFLQGLKHNWEELQKQYQGLPILTDTIPKINRKSKLEAELKQLEKDIVLVERHPYIYVYDDNVFTMN